MSYITIDQRNHTFLDFECFFKGPIKVKLLKKSEENIKNSHKNFTKKLYSSEVIYGVNTGFGKLSNVSISDQDQILLQENLVRSHASGIGKPFDLGLVRVILYLKILTFIKGYSGIRLQVVQKIIEYLNHDILPVIPQKGSVGASGDLAPMGHMALSLIGEGEVFFDGKRSKTSDILNQLNIQPLKLEPKEGLSLINGTQVSTAIAIKTLLNGKVLMDSADVVGGISVENSYSSLNVFRKEIHEAKMHLGQRKSAEIVYNILQDSEIINSHKDCDKVQDPYSFRCIPHVHGASRDIFENAAEIINNEINSVSDNPLILKDGTIASSGHFHAEHVAQSLDSLAVAFSELGAISERRIHNFMKGVKGKFEPFVAIKPGLESGYMIAHVTATALASENKTLAHPASVDSINSSAGQEDLVSMAPWAGNKLLMIQENVCTILSIELLVACAVNYICSSNMKSGSGIRKIISYVKNKCEFHIGDRSLYSEITLLKHYIETGDLLNQVDYKL